jgi:hypothetical protein
MARRVRTGTGRLPTLVDGPLGHATDAFDEYLAALDNEEHAADLYAQLIRRIRQRVSVRPWDQRTKRPRRPPRP